MRKKGLQWLASGVCLLVGLGLFWLIGCVTGWDGWFPYMHLFNALCILIWCVTLYVFWIRALTRRACLILALLTVVFALPHLLGALLTYGSWICLGISTLLIAVLLIAFHRKKKAAS